MGEPDSTRAKIMSYIIVLLIVTLVVLIYLKFFEQLNYRIIFFDIGQGDSALIRFENNEKMLIDCGPDRSVLNKLGRYLPFYDRTIDYLIVTHFDLDHYGGCDEVLERYKIKNIFINSDNKSGDRYFDKWIVSLKEEKANVKIVTSSFSFDIAGAQIDVLSPDPNIPSSIISGNNHSIVFRLTYGTTTVFFSADMEESVEKELVDYWCEKPKNNDFCINLKSEYLKVGHHGSDSSSGSNFLSAISPKNAIISVGKNHFGHPSLRVLRRIERVGAEIWRTDELTDIIIR